MFSAPNQPQPRATNLKSRTSTEEQRHKTKTKQLMNALIFKGEKGRERERSEKDLNDWPYQKSKTT